jgi:uncharacterized cupredoxin-like copper-binding protein
MNDQKQTKKKLFIILGILVVAIIVVAVAMQANKGIKINNQDAVIPQKENGPVATTSADEIAPSKSVVSQAPVTPEILKEATVIATGTSLITKDNKVVTPAGAPVKLNVMPSSQEAPKESAPIALNKIPESSNNVKISVSAAGFSPSTFTVKEGQLVNFVLTSTDDFTHVWLLDDTALIGTVLGVAGKETRVKSWNAPKKGEYAFHCDIPGHKDRGEVGKMIVQ